MKIKDGFIKTEIADKKKIKNDKITIKTYINIHLLII